MKFKVNGRSVSSRKLGDAILSSMQSDIQKQTEKLVTSKLSSVRCPTHHQTPRNIRFKGSILKETQVEMDYCCDRLKEAVKKALK